MPPARPFNDEIESALERLVHCPRLLVSTDFDGTISAVCVDHSDAELDPGARAALRKLSEFPGTHVAIISGRMLADLTRRCSGLDRVRFIGSHGSEFEINSFDTITAAQQTLLKAAARILQKFNDLHPGTQLEHKFHGAALHYRTVADPKTFPEMVERELLTLGGGAVKHGSFVVEFSVVDTDKGEALERLRQEFTPSMILFLGDDTTDEDAFRVMGEIDVSIKLGDGKTLARLRLPSHVEAVQFLERLAEERGAWLRSQPSSLIDHSLFLSDMRTAAIVDDRCSVIWFCVPAIDGAPLFGSLVGGPGAGHFSITAGRKLDSHYIGDTFIGRTNFETMSVTDFLDCSSGLPFERPGRTNLFRILEGSGEVAMEFAPKFDFGRSPTRVTQTDGGLKGSAGHYTFTLSSPGIEWEMKREGIHDVARARFTLPGRCALELSVGGAELEAKTSEEVALHETSAFWSTWAAALQIPDYYREELMRSALVLRGLTHGPNGSMVAAATTSLPEKIGGVRNWDYRFCWPRDSCLSATALAKLGDTSTGLRLLEWLLNIAKDCGPGRFIDPLYTVSGVAVVGEAEIAEASGYRGSKPVRIGNLAAGQLQLDTLGPISELLCRLVKCGAALHSEHLAFCDRLVELVAARWKDPDSGIWEIRGEERHFVHSKLMCWYTVENCLAVARYLDGQRPQWEQLKSEIRAEIETHGYSEKRKSYIAAYDLPYPEAGLLWIVLTGFHPPDHPRCVETVKFVKDHLLKNGVVFRYHFEDALPGDEGAFHICLSWLIEAL